jgi:HSP20 family protein
MTYSITRRNTAPLFGAFDTLFDDFFGTSSSSTSTVDKDGKISKYVETPKANVYESDTEVGVQLALPGYNKKDIQVRVKNNVLTVEASKEVKTDNLVSQEFYATEAKRSFRLGNEVDGGNVKAEYVNGILSLTLQKKAEAAPRTIDIE